MSLVKKQSEDTKMKNNSISTFEDFIHKSNREIQLTLKGVNTKIFVLALK